MKRRESDYDDAWFAKLDDIVTKRQTPSHEDDDLLHLAAKLADAVAQLNLDTLDRHDWHVTRAHRKSQQHTTTFVKSRKCSLLQTLLTIVAVLFVFVGIICICTTSAKVTTVTRKMGKQIWQDTTSFEQIDASPLAIIAVKKAGVHPLLPTNLLVDTQPIDFGIIIDDVNPHSFRAFTAEYRIRGQIVSIYEQATNLVFPSLTAQDIPIGLSKGHLFQDNTGNRLLQWYQSGMTCQIASTLPIQQLLVLARQFHPITQWELLII